LIPHSLNHSFIGAKDAERHPSVKAGNNDEQGCQNIDHSFVTIGNGAGKNSPTPLVL
jgi:hypothetical protein